MYNLKKVKTLMPLHDFSVTSVYIVSGIFVYLHSQMFNLNYLPCGVVTAQNSLADAQQFTANISAPTDALYPWTNCTRWCTALGSLAFSFNIIHTVVQFNCQ